MVNYKFQDDPDISRLLRKSRKKGRKNTSLIEISVSQRWQKFRTPETYWWKQTTVRKFPRLWLIENYKNIWSEQLLVRFGASSGKFHRIDPRDHLKKSETVRAEVEVFFWHVGFEDVKKYTYKEITLGEYGKEAGFSVHVSP